MISKEQNFKSIIQSLPSDTPEIKYVILKSQLKTKGKGRGQVYQCVTV